MYVSMPEIANTKLILQRVSQMPNIWVEAKHRIWCSSTLVHVYFGQRSAIQRLTPAPPTQSPAHRVPQTPALYSKTLWNSQISMMISTSMGSITHLDGSPAGSGIMVHQVYFISTMTINIVQNLTFGTARNRSMYQGVSTSRRIRYARSTEGSLEMNCY